MSSRAVIIKGPMSDSRSYITVLPDNMESLIQKARDLFSVPPNHTPHFTLADDASVIVLPDFLPLIREREILVFRWTPDTPRSSLRRTTGQPHLIHCDTPNLESNSKQSSVEMESVNDGSLFGKSARGVRWDESVVSNEDKNKRIPPRIRGNKDGKDSNSSRHRAEYVKQKIQEQEDIRRREGTMQQPMTAGQDPFVALDETNGTDSNDNAPTLDSSSNKSITNEDLLISGSSPPSYTSALPKVSSQSDEEQQTSSPLASPTRDVRGARKNDHGKLWMMGLCSEKEQATEKGETVMEEAMVQQEAEEHREEAAQQEITIKHNTPPKTNVVVPEAESEEGSKGVEENVDELEERAVEQATSPQRKEETQEVNIRDLPAYQTMKSVVNQLRSHPSNHSFRQPCEEELKKFCQDRNRPIVDFFTISNAITLGSYGIESPLESFSADLQQMWNNVRVFYGPQSLQTHCANTLETFSSILLEEWKRHSGTVARPNKPRSHSTAVIRSFNTPMSRREKHNGKPSQDVTPKSQQAAYFASLMAKNGNSIGASSSSPSRLVSKAGNPTLKRPAGTTPTNERPLKKSLTSTPTTTTTTNTTTSTTALPLVTVTNENAQERETPNEAVKLVTRGTAKRLAARAAQAA